MSKVLKFWTIVAALLVLIAAQWHALSTLRRENRILQQRINENEQARVNSDQQRQSSLTSQLGDDSLRNEVLGLRAQVHSLRDELEQSTARASQLALPAEQLPLAFNGDAALPRRVLPPAGPLPRDFNQYRLQMRYTGLTTVLQKKEPDGTYTDVIEGPKEIGIGENHLFVQCWPDPSRMSGSLLIIDLNTGQMIEKTSVSISDNPARDNPPESPEWKAAQWFKRDVPNPNDPQNWILLFR